MTPKPLSTWIHFFPQFLWIQFPKTVIYNEDPPKKVIHIRYKIKTKKLHSQTHTGKTMWLSQPEINEWDKRRQHISLSDNVSSFLIFQDPKISPQRPRSKSRTSQTFLLRTLSLESKCHTHTQYPLDASLGHCPHGATPSSFLLKAIHSKKEGCKGMTRLDKLGFWKVSAMAPVKCRREHACLHACIHACTWGGETLQIWGRGGRVSELKGAWAAPKKTGETLQVELGKSQREIAWR